MFPHLDVESAFARGGGGAFKHRRGNVSQRDLPAGSGQEKARMPRAGGDIQRPAWFPPWQSLQGALHVRYIGQDVALAVAVTLSIKLLLRRALDRI